MTLEPLQDYEVTEELWRGSHGLVAYAIDPHSAKRFLIKEIILPAEPDEQQRWGDLVQTRADQWMQAAWPGAVPPLHLEGHGRLLRLVFDDPRGMPLQRMAEEAHLLFPSQACHIVLRLAECLRDLRSAGASITLFEPHCVFMISDDECLWADLSINELLLALRIPLREHREYLPPDSAQRALSGEPESLLAFGLGVFLHRLLAGRGPEELEEETPLWVLNPQVSSALDALVRRAISTQSSQRFQSLPEFIDALHRLPEEEQQRHPLIELEGEPPEVEPAFAPAPKSRALLWAALSAVALLVAAAVLFLVFGRRPEPAPTLMRPPLPRAGRRPAPPPEQPATAAPEDSQPPAAGGVSPPQPVAPPSEASRGLVPPGAGRPAPSTPNASAPQPAAGLPPSQQSGGLRVVVQPPGASVYVDDVFVGVAADALLVRDLTPGSHSVRVELPGHNPSRSTVSIPVGSTHSIAVRLTPSPPGG